MPNHSPALFPMIRGCCAGTAAKANFPLYDRSLPPPFAKLENYNLFYLSQDMVNKTKCWCWKNGTKLSIRCYCFFIAEFDRNCIHYESFLMLESHSSVLYVSDCGVRSGEFESLLCFLDRVPSSFAVLWWFVFVVFSLCLLWIKITCYYHSYLAGMEILWRWWLSSKGE